MTINNIIPVSRTSGITLKEDQQRDGSSAWWKQRSRLERCLLAIAGAAMLACVALAVMLALSMSSRQQQLSLTPLDRETSRQDSWSGLHSAPSSSSLNSNDSPSEFGVNKLQIASNKQSICTTKGCVKYAATLLDNMDATANPCEDFYQYSCGGFVERTVIPEDSGSVSQFKLIEDQLSAKLRSAIETPKNQNESAIFHMVKDLYSTCINTTQIDEEDVSPLKVLLEELGGWPAVRGFSWRESEFNWVQMMHAFRQRGLSVDYLFDLSVIEDLKNTKVRVLEIDQPDLGMPDRSYLLKGFEDPTVQRYFQLQLELAELLGANKETAKAELKDSLLFEMELAQFSLPREERRNFTKLYHRLAIADLDQIAPIVNWSEYLTQILNQPILDSEPVIVAVPSYLKNLTILLEKTKKRTVANYLMWRVVMSLSSHLSKRVRDIRLTYYKKLTGQMQEDARWMQCIGMVNSAIGNAVGALYVQKYFKHSAKLSAQEMVDGIMNEFRNILTEIDWMDNVTKQRAIQKSGSIKQHIAYPDEILHHPNLWELYKNMSVTDDSYFRNILRIRKFSMDYAFGQLRKPVIKNDWKTHGQAAIVNAFYSSTENSIQFPAGILQGVFFDSDRPRYTNYGSIGFVIGHEITHGFDDQGRQFDKEGNLKNWWESETDAHFHDKAQCIIQQYGNYTVIEGLNINGINTQGENIADNGGMKEAHRAYSRWVQRHGAEVGLPGIDHSPKQLFWLSFANIWCAKYRPEALMLRVRTGVHSPSKYRVIGVASNSPEFAKDFNCPLGSPMNPVNKCNVW